MDGLFYPVNTLYTDVASTNIDADKDKKVLDKKYGDWLESLWDYEEGTVEILQPNKIASQDTHVYRVGNICVLKIQITRSSADSSETYSELYQIPWAPFGDIYDRRNYGYKSGASPVYTCFHCKIDSTGKVYVCSYKGIQEYCAILSFPIMYAI